MRWLTQPLHPRPGWCEDVNSTTTAVQRQRPLLLIRLPALVYANSKSLAIFTQSLSDIRRNGSVTDTQTKSKQATISPPPPPMLSVLHCLGRIKVLVSQHFNQSCSFESRLYRVSFFGFRPWRLANGLIKILCQPRFILSSLAVCVAGGW